MAVIGSDNVQVDSALGAQPGTIGPAQQRPRERQRKCVASPGAQVEDPVLDVWRGEIVGLPLLRDLTRVDGEPGFGCLQAAHARSAQGCLEPQPQGVAVSRGPRDVEPNGDELGRDRVTLAPERERIEADVQLQPATFAGGESQCPEIERVSTKGHLPQISDGQAIIRLVSTWFRTYGFADVLDGLLIGAYPLDRDDVGMLEWVGIERVLNLVEDEEYRPGDREKVESALEDAGIDEYRLELTDYGGLSADELEIAVLEINAWLDDGIRTYLHCRAGWQRSAAIAAGVVAVRSGIDIDDALAFVQSRKPSADPLPHQRADLRAWWDGRAGATARGAPGAGSAEIGSADLRDDEAEPAAGERDEDG